MVAVSHFDLSHPSEIYQLYHGCLGIYTLSPRVVSIFQAIPLQPWYNYYLNTVLPVMLALMIVFDCFQIA